MFERFLNHRLMDSKGEHLALPVVSAILGSRMTARERIAGEQWSTISHTSMATFARLRELGTTARRAPDAVA